jgi:hypothetical protein
MRSFTLDDTEIDFQGTQEGTMPTETKQSQSPELPTENIATQLAQRTKPKVIIEDLVANGVGRPDAEEVVSAAVREQKTIIRRKGITSFITGLVIIGTGLALSTISWGCSSRVGASSWVPRHRPG